MEIFLLKFDTKCICNDILCQNVSLFYQNKVLLSCKVLQLATLQSVAVLQSVSFLQGVAVLQNVTVLQSCCYQSSSVLSSIYV